MNFNNFTIKAQEAVQQAAQMVTQNNQQAIEPTHLLKAVMLTGDQFHLPEVGCEYTKSRSGVGSRDPVVSEGIGR